jgi:hypothetical protein
MVIKGIVHNGQIQIENSALPDGTQVLITPIHTANAKVSPDQDWDGLKANIKRIASLKCENRDDDGFSGADHDKVLYGS